MKVSCPIPTEAKQRRVKREKAEGGGATDDRMSVITLFDWTIFRLSDGNFAEANV